MRKDPRRVACSVEISIFWQLQKTGVEPVTPRLLGYLTVSVKVRQKAAKRNELIHTAQLHVRVQLLKKSTAPG